jgi:hypothetical protein
MDEENVRREDVYKASRDITLGSRVVRAGDGLDRSCSRPLQAFQPPK